MAARKPKIVYEWVWKSNRVKTAMPSLKQPGLNGDWKVDWALIGANGEHMCGSNQGFTDKTDARRSVDAVAFVLTGSHVGAMREVGPGKKPS